jgi:hypothetical protein
LKKIKIKHTLPRFINGDGTRIRALKKQYNCERIMFYFYNATRKTVNCQQKLPRVGAGPANTIPCCAMIEKQYQQQ